jgi:membrane peptidoglycan carboxypeptidase
MGSRRRRLTAVLVVVVLVAPVAALAAAWRSTPGVGDLPRRVAQHARPGQVGPVALGSVSPLAIEALIATEDERYRSNSGIDVIGLMRAIPYDVTHLSLAQGGSTLTEQLAKNLWLGGSDENVRAKLEDMALALKLDERWSKDTILDAYLNTAYFGQGAYGIAEASRRYFATTPAALTPAQATVLVGLVQAPTSYDPYTHPAASRLRQISVLRSLVRVGRFAPARAERVLAEPLRLADGRSVPGLRGVDLSAGPAFDLGGLAIALVVLLAACAAVLGRRILRGRHTLLGRLALVLALGLVGASAVEAIRSLRVI